MQTRTPEHPDTVLEAEAVRACLEDRVSLYTRFIRNTDTVSAIYLAIWAMALTAKLAISFAPDSPLAGVPATVALVLSLAADSEASRLARELRGLVGGNTQHTQNTQHSTTQ